MNLLNKCLGIVAIITIYRVVLASLSHCMCGEMTVNRIIFRRYVEFREQVQEIDALRLYRDKNKRNFAFSSLFL